MNRQNNSNTNSSLEQALNLVERYGWSVIPIDSQKRPLISWKKYQKVKPTRKEIEQWFTKYPNANIGVVTGEISDLTVIDIDPRHNGTDEAFCDLETISVKTGGGGFHYYFKYEKSIKNGAGLKPGIDIRSEGGYVVVPPSLHQLGIRYEWMKSPENSSLLPLPTFVKEWIKESKNKPLGSSSWDNTILNGVGEGQRNDSATSVIGKLLKRFNKDEWETEAWPFLKAWNTNNTPPLPETELHSIFESIKLRELQSGDFESSGKESLAKMLVSAILESEIILFHDQYKEGYAALTGDGQQVLKLRSKGFRQWIAHFSWETFDKIASSETIINVVQTLEGRALFEGEEFELAVRLCQYQDAIWYDLGNGKAIKIDKSRWNIVDNPPILFKRFAHQTKQVAPVQGANLSDICNFINLKNDGDRLLFQVFVVASFIPNFPHPILVFFGPQGAGKSTPMRLLKSLIDPSALKTLSVPDSEREFAQLASHHHFFFFDNLSTLPSWLSDSLAKASTGDGFSKRELYSDDDDVIYSFQRIMGINGINLVVYKADLLDRSILLGLERIAKHERRQEQEFWKKFDELKPQLLGAIFTAVSQAIHYYPTISLSSYPRMADFTRWGCAIARGLGYTDNDFLNAYFNNINAQSEAAIDASPIGTALVALMETQSLWVGTASELLTMLETVAETIKINTKGRGWPKEPSWLVRKIQVILPNLLEQGVKVTRDDKARPKTITLEKVLENTDNVDISTDKLESVPTDKASSSSSKELNVDSDTDGQIGLLNHSAPSPTPQSVNSPDNLGKREEQLSKSQAILKQNIETEKTWNAAMKEFGIKN